MIFYEDFLKRLESADFVIEDREVFNVEVKKLISVVGVGIALSLIGLFQLYMLFISKGNIGKAIFGVVLLFLAFRQFRVVYTYRMVINYKDKILKSSKITIDLNNVESCTLKEAKVGKHIETVVDIITTDNIQFIIPFYMRKKVKFAYVLKNILKDRFKIKEK